MKINIKRNIIVLMLLVILISTTFPVHAFPGFKEKMGRLLSLASITPITSQTVIVTVYPSGSGDVQIYKNGAYLGTTSTSSSYTFSTSDQIGLVPYPRSGYKFKELCDFWECLTGSYWGPLYQDLSIYSVTARFEATTTPTPMPTSPVTSILVDSVPQGASVLLNGIYQGTTPFQLNNQYIYSKYLTFTKTGYETLTYQITVSTQPIKVTLKPLAGTTPQPTTTSGSGYSVRITSVPSGASIAVDGTRVGSTPFDLPMQVGASKTITLSLYGYQTASRTVYYNSGSINVNMIQFVQPTAQPTYYIPPTVQPTYYIPPTVTVTIPGTTIPTPIGTDPVCPTGLVWDGTKCTIETTTSDNTIYYISGAIILGAVVYFSQKKSNKKK